MKELIFKVEEWAKERGLLNPEFAEAQYLKFIEECGKTARAILKKDEAGIIDGFGDIAVTVIILAKQLDCHLLIKDTQFTAKSFKYFLDPIDSEYVSQYSLTYLDACSRFYGYDLQMCLESAYNEIKNRKGKTENGTFVKEQA